MARQPKRTDARLQALDDLASRSDVGEIIEPLRVALTDTNSAVVRRAARIAADRLCYEMIPSLVGAFDRLLADNPARRDPNCLGKAAIVKALFDLDYLDAEFYGRGLHYHQYEPVWGGSTDTAVDVRCTCAMGLAATPYPRALMELIELLADEAAAARIAAVQAIALLEPFPSEAILRHKVLSGDDEPLVISECFSALLKLEPDESVAFVAQSLEHKEVEIARLAALALGESRLPAAFAPLASMWEQRRLEHGFASVLLKALALHRSMEAMALLLSVISEARTALAADAISALAEVSSSERIKAQVATALDKRSGRDLDEHLIKIGWSGGLRY